MFVNPNVIVKRLSNVKFGTLIELIDKHTLIYESINTEPTPTRDQTVIYFLSSLLNAYCPELIINTLIIRYTSQSHRMFDTLTNNFPITHVSFEGCHIASISQIRFKKSITHLKITSVLREYRPSNLMIFSNTLVKLTCTKCKITSITSYLPETLIYLNCSSNHITHLEYLPCGLKTLICSNNLICVLDSLPNGLEYLDCAHNSLKCLSGIPITVETLYCEYNQLVTVYLGKTLRLKELVLSGNYVSVLDVEFLGSCLKHVEILHADNMCINEKFTELNVGIVNCDFSQWIGLHTIIFSLHCEHSVVKKYYNGQTRCLKELDLSNVTIILCLNIPCHLKWFITSYSVFTITHVVMESFGADTVFKIHARNMGWTCKENLEMILDNLGIGNYLIV